MRPLLAALLLAASAALAESPAPAGSGVADLTGVKFSGPAWHVDPSEARGVLVAREQDVMGCLGPGVRAGLRLQVEASGRVIGAGRSDEDGVDVAASRCLAQVASGWGFPSGPPGEDSHVSATFQRLAEGPVLLTGLSVVRRHHVPAMTGLLAAPPATPAGLGESLSDNELKWVQQGLQRKDERPRPAVAGESRLVPGPIAVSGGLKPDIVRKVVAMYRNQVRYCHEVELQRHPRLSGKVTLVLDVRPDGKVRKSSMETGAPQPVVPCLLRRARTWRFPQASSPSRVRFTFTLQAPES